MPHRAKAEGRDSHSKTTPASFMGLQVSGDLGPWTIFTDRRRRKSVFYYTPPTKVATPRQAAARARFAAAVNQWKATTTEQKEALENLARAASLCLTGQNLYVSAAMTNRIDSLQKLANEKGITIPLPDPV